MLTEWLMAIASPRFPDIQTHWARLFIEGLAQRRIVNGYPDGIRSSL